MAKLNVRQALLAAALSAALVPVALACYTYTAGPGFNGTEGPTCTAAPACSTYWSCPGGDTCPWSVWTQMGGTATCPCTTVTLTCRAYTGGIVNTAGCCTGGNLMPTQPTPPAVVTVASCMPAGTCYVGKNPTE